MRKRILVGIMVAILGLQVTAATAGPSMCDIMYKIGVRNVRECEDPKR